MRGLDAAGSLLGSHSLRYTRYRELLGAPGGERSPLGGDDSLRALAFSPAESW